MTSGLFITFEGPEGSGKSTLIRQVTEKFEELGREVVHTREPGGTPTGEVIRQILQHGLSKEPISPPAEVLLFSASRAQLVHNVIRPALERGAVVLSDRFMDSTTVYQGVGRGLGMETMETINFFAVDGVIPTRTLLLDVETELGLARLDKRYEGNEGEGHDTIELAGIEFHKRVREGYLTLAKKYPDRFVVLDASGTVDEVFVKAWPIVEAILNEKE